MRGMHTDTGLVSPEKGRYTTTARVLSHDDEIASLGKEVMKMLVRYWPKRLYENVKVVQIVESRTRN